MKKDFENTIINCACHSSEHRFVLIADNYEPEFPETYMEMQLIQYRSFFKRIMVAIKYIFGYQSRYGHWDTINFDLENMKEFNSFLSERIRVHEEAESARNKII